MPTQRERMPTQRDVMRRIYYEYDGEKTAVVQAYAQAERNGEVLRKRNEHGLTPEEYAEWLFRDGERKGWIQEGC